MQADAPAPISLTLHISSSEALASDAVELERVALRLRSELRALDLERISPVSSTSIAALGTKASALAEAGQLLVVALPIALPKLIDFMQAWCLRHKDRTVRIKSREIEIEFPPGGLPASELKHILEQISELHPGDPSKR